MLIRNLQALRAFAALSVAYFHLFIPVFNVGQSGVDVFFVISGFMMSQVCATRPERFLARRLIRIVPIYWVYTLGLFAVALAAPTLLVSVRPDMANLLKSLFFVPYLKENGLINPIVPQGWTLNYEMLFYGLVGVCLLAVRPAAATALASVLLIAVSGAARTWGSGAAATFYGSPIIGEFALGVAAFWIWKRLPTGRRPRPALLLAIVSLSCLALVLSDYFRLDRVVPSGRLLAFGLPAFGLVGAVLLLEDSRRVTNGLILLLGNASYSIYLSHLFVIEFVGRIVARAVPALHPTRPAGMVVTFILILGTGLASYVLLELRLTGILKRVFLESVEPSEADALRKTP